MPMDWDKLRIFYKVANAGSFTHASETLNLSQSAISRQISSLESEVGVPLFHRHARGLILTEQGEILYRTAHDVFSRLRRRQTRKAHRSVEGDDDGGRGIHLVDPSFARIYRPLSRHQC